MSAQPATTSSAPRSDELPDERDFNQLWKKALDDYKAETGKDLRELPVAKNFPSGLRTTNQVIEHFKTQEGLFKDFRARGKKVRAVLTPIVDVLLFLKDGAGGVSDPIPGGDMIFGAIGVLLQATKGVSELYDAVETLLKEVLASLQRFEIHFEGPPMLRATLEDIIVYALVQVFMVLALATKYCNLVAKGEPWYRRVIRVLLLRAKDYSLVLTDKVDVQGVLEELQTLAMRERQLFIAATHAVRGETKADVAVVKPKVDYAHHKAVVDDIYKWLDPPRQRPTTYEAKRQIDGCAWFFDGQFDDWKARRNGVYWVYGNAGAGKSVLSFSVVDKLQADAALSVVYFHFDFNDTKKQDCRALVSSLVFQLGTKFEDCLEYLKGKRSPTDPPTYEQLLGLLSHLLSLSGCTFVVIDALDECPKSARDKGLKGLLDTLCSLEEDNLRLLLTSRPEPDIRKCISPRATHILSLNDAIKHMEELRSHIETRLSNRHSYNWPDDVRATAQRLLFEASKGMFLWVDLQLNPLMHCRNLSDVELVLNDLPNDLNATYERILMNFNAPHFTIKQARHAFECVAVAKRPLSPAEVAVILSSPFDAPLNTPVVSDLEVPIGDPEAFIRENCPGLLDIIVSDEGHKVVQFIHFSASQYLMSSQLERAPSPVWVYRFDEDSAVLTLARICISALVVVGPPSHIQSYANEHWSEHISSRNDDALGELLIRFLYMGSSSFTRWATNRTSHTALHMATKLGLCHHVTRILETPHGGSATPIDNVARVRNKYDDTALHIGAKNGHAEVVRSLLYHGALINDTNERKDTALHLAAEFGHLDVVRVLLDHPAVDEFDTAASRCRAHGPAGKTALHNAASRGHIEVVRILLDCGALVSDTDENDDTPLHAAALSGYLDVVRVLCEHPPANESDTAAHRLRASNGGGKIALLHAARQGRADVARILLEHGTPIGVTDEYGNTPLHEAASLGHPDVVRVLCEYPPGSGCDTAAHPSRAINLAGKTALHNAARQGCAKVALILLDHGAPVDAVAKTGDTPLHDAAYSGDVNVVRVVLRYSTLDNTTRCRARNKSGKTPLHTAAGGGHSEVCEVLLAEGALVSDVNSDGNTPLHEAAYSGHLDTVRILLECPPGSGSDNAATRCCARNGNGMTVLHYAAKQGYVEMCHYLLEHDAPVDEVDAFMRTPLQLAESFGHLDVARMLSKRRETINSLPTMSPALALST